MADSTSDLIVIGAGITGLNAAKHAASHGMSVTTLEAALFGGLVANVNELDGLNTSISGYRMASRLRVELTRLGVANRSETARSIERLDDLIEVRTEDGVHEAAAVVVASGATLKRLNIPGEERLTGKGVSHCVDCDAPLHKGREIAIVGGGDSAVQSAIVAARHCQRVHLVHRRSSLRAKPHLVDRVTALANIVVHYGAFAEEVLGDDVVAGLRIRDAAGKIHDIACTGVFAYVGLAPNAGFVPSSVVRDEHGALRTDQALQTSLAGVFAAGAVRSGYAGMLTDAEREARAAVDNARERMGA